MRLVLQSNTPLFCGSVEEDHENEILVSCRKKFEFHEKAFVCYMHVNPLYLVFRCGNFT